MPRNRIQVQSVTSTLTLPEQVAVSETKQPPVPVAIIAREIRTVTVSVPLGEIGCGHRPSHVQCWLKPPQAESLQRLVVALRDQRAVTGEGREIRTAADAVRWLLERLAGAT